MLNSRSRMDPILPSLLLTSHLDALALVVDVEIREPPV